MSLKDVSALRKYEKIVNAVFCVSFLAWYVTAMTAIGPVFYCIGGIFFVADIVLYILIYKYKGKDQPLIIHRKMNSRGLLATLGAGLVLAFATYIYRDDTILLILTGIMSLFFIFSPVYVFFNRKKLRAKGAIE